MMRGLFLSFFILTTLFADEVLLLQDGFVAKNTLGYTYFKEQNIGETPEDILNSSELTKAQKLNLGLIDTPLWSRVFLKNDTNRSRHFVLYNDRPGTNQIDVFIYKNKLLLKQHHLGDMNPQGAREFLHRYSAFILDMNANETLTVVTRVQNYGVYNIGYHIEDPKYFFQKEQNISIMFGLLGGFLLFYGLFNIVLYILSKEKIYLLLVGVVTSVSIYIYSVHGYLYSFDLGISLHLITTFAWISALFSVLFLVLFAYYFFHVSLKYKKIALLLRLKIIVILLIISVTLVMIYVNPALFEYYKYISAFYLINPLLMLLFALYLIYKREEFSLFYFFGQLIVTFGNFYHTAQILGSLPMQDYAVLVLPASITLEALFLLLIVYKKSKKFYIHQQQEREFLMEQLRYVSIGQAIGGVVHQWKTPLTHIGSIVTILESELYFQKQNIVSKLQKYLPELRENIEYMSISTDEILGQYSTKSVLKEFYFEEIVNKHILKMLSSKITLKNANIVLNVEKNFTLKMDENIFLNVLIILMDNSLDAMSEGGTIWLNAEKRKNEYVLECEDDCGGVNAEPIERIFEYQYSLKEQGHGIGLAILKILIQERVNGSIKVSNTDKGVHFRITIPIES